MLGLWAARSCFTSPTAGQGSRRVSCPGSLDRSTWGSRLRRERWEDRSGASSATTPLGDAQEQVKAALLISSLLPFVSAGSPALPPLQLANLLQLSKQCVSAATGGWGNDGHSDGEAARHCAEILGWACFVLNVCKDSNARLHPPPPLSGDDGNARSTPAIYDWLANKIGDVFRACVSSPFALREVRLYVVVFDYRDTVDHTSD